MLITNAVPHPPLQYVGSKWLLGPWVVANMPSHNCYVEVFGGGASVLLRKPRVPVEFCNDLDGDITNFFTVLRDNPDGLIRWLLATPLNQRVIEGPQPTEPIARAGWTFQRQWGRYVGGGRSTFSLSTHENQAELYERRARQLGAAAARFRGVTITNLDYRELLPRLDRPGVLLYGDAPYVGREANYAAPFTSADHAILAEQVHALKHARAVLSYGDDPLIRELYAGMAIFEKQVRTAAGSGKIKPWRTELLIVTRPRPR